MFTSMVAELATFQNRPAPDPVLITFTTELGEVINVSCHLEYPGCVGVAAAVEGECPGKIGRARGNRINARRKRPGQGQVGIDQGDTGPQ